MVRKKVGDRKDCRGEGERKQETKMTKRGEKRVGGVREESTVELGRRRVSRKGGRKDGKRE